MLSIKSVSNQAQRKALNEALEAQKIFRKYLQEGHKAKIILKKHPLIPKFGAFATQEGIAFGSVLGIFGGIFIESVKSQYCEGVVDAKKIGNITSRINNGFPNNFTYYVIDKGTLYSILIVTDSNGIAPHEEILSTWGLPYSENLGFRQPCKLLGEKRMLSFFSKGLEPIYDSLKLWEKKFDHQKVKIDELYFKFCDLKDKFFYPLENPAALLKLHYLKMIPISLWQAILHDSNSLTIIKNWKNSTEKEVPSVINMLYNLMQLVIDADKILSPNLKILVDKWMLENLSKVGLIKLAKALSLIKSYVEKNLLKNETQWNDFQAKILNPFMIKDYDWAHDNSNPIIKSYIPEV